MWQKKVKELAAEHNMEIHELDSIHIIHPRPVSNDIKKAFLELIPNHTCKFIEGVKDVTVHNISFVALKYMIIIGEIKQDNRKITIKVFHMTENMETFFEDISSILRADGYFDSWTMISYDNSFNKTGYYIIRSSNKRNTIIQKDDITNLIITLKTTNSVEEFLKQL